MAVIASLVRVGDVLYHAGRAGWGPGTVLSVRSVRVPGKTTPYRAFTVAFETPDGPRTVEVVAADLRKTPRGTAAPGYFLNKARTYYRKKS